MKDFFESFMNAMTDRVSNPFIGSFVISWILWNWQFVFFLLTANVEAHVKLELLISEYSDIDRMSWLPLIFALIYILGMPYVYWGIEKIQKHAKIGRYKYQKKYLQERAVEIRESADIAEGVVEDKERLDAANLKISNYSTDENNKNVFIYKDFIPGPISLDVGKGGGILKFARPINKISFKFTCHEADPILASEYIVRTGNFTGRDVGRYSLEKNGELVLVHLEFTEKTDQVTIVNTDSRGTNIEIYELCGYD